MTTTTGRTNLTCVSGMAAMAWDLPDEIAMYRRTGVDLIGLQAAKTARFGVDAVGELLQQNDVTLGYLVHGFSAPPDDDAAWASQVDALTHGIENAHTLGAELVYLTSGPSGQLSWDDAADRFVRRVRPAVERAGELGVRLGVENTLPIKADISFTHTARDAIALADELGIGICLDLYCCWQERGLSQLIRDRVGSIALLQVSDFVVGTSSFPNRWVPGDADLPMARLLGEVLDAGYQGIVDVELLGPAIEAEGAESAITRSVAWMRERIGAGR